MSPSVELQTLIYDTLIADSAVSALIGSRVYDHRPDNSDYPCVTFGPSDHYDEELECLQSRVETVQLDVWSRDQGRLRPCKEICDAIRVALHLADLSLSVNALVQIRVDGVRVFSDADGITAHGVVTVEAVVEER